MRVVLHLFVFLLLCSFVSSLHINEIMYNPSGTDNNNEYIEVFSEEEINLSGYIIEDLDSNDFLELVKYYEGSYSLIVEEGFNYSGISASIYSAGATIGNNLKNDYEEIILNDNFGDLVDSVNYSSTLGGDGNGFSICEIGGVWGECIATPGTGNIIHEGVSDEVISSKIEIKKIYDLGSDDEAKFGQVIRVKINVYKGDTRKSVIYVWVEDRERISKKTSVNVYDKFNEVEFTLPVQIDLNCNGEFKDDDYYVIVEGLDTKDRYEIEVGGGSSSLCKVVEEKKQQQKFSYELVDKPIEIIVGEKFPIKIVLNGDNELHTIKVWSYVYRGSKCYSGSREENMKTIYLMPRETLMMALYNKVVEADPGDYKLKVLIKKDDQKTNYDITEEVKVKERQIVVHEEEIIHKKRYEIIYESQEEEIKKLIPYLIILISIILNVVLIWKR